MRQLRKLGLTLQGAPTRLERRWALMSCPHEAGEQSILSNLSFVSPFVALDRHSRGISELKNLVVSL